MRLNRLALVPLLLIAAPVAQAPLAQPAWAQLTHYGAWPRKGLTHDDLARRRAAALKLLKEDGGKVGASEDWAGARSGNHGTVSVERALTYKGMECRQVLSHTEFKTMANPTDFRQSVCRTPDRGWKLVDIPKQ